MIVAFENLELDLARGELRRSGVRVPVEPQVFEVLAYLVDHRDLPGRTSPLGGGPRTAGVTALLIAMVSCACWAGRALSVW